MILLPHSIWSILLALSFLFNRACGEREVIAYRTVSEEEAAYINRHNKPYRDKKHDRFSRWNQLASGFYTTNEPAGWRGYTGDEYCVIKADSDKFESARKVWIPKTTGDEASPTLLWSGNEERILDYIRSLGVPEPENALRFSHISLHPGKLQMVIPTDMINNDDLDLWAECWKSPKDLLNHASETVDWSRWAIAGHPGPGEALGSSKTVPVNWKPSIWEPGASAGAFAKSKTLRMSLKPSTSRNKGKASVAAARVGALAKSQTLRIGWSPSIWKASASVKKKGKASDLEMSDGDPGTSARAYRKSKTLRMSWKPSVPDRKKGKASDPGTSRGDPGTRGGALGKSKTFRISWRPLTWKPSVSGKKKGKASDPGTSGGVLAKSQTLGMSWKPSTSKSLISVKKEKAPKRHRWWSKWWRLTPWA
ncbi:uncharacterized protein L3040_008221 [Drepanopeziza brunnea f. sp. 'multigermtubi']|uniref:Uncharacterized protein n=1 Tax=Marssonina brunnea f. sp. multigermtubi (strain MB_m1) TaxID=1072389 RepID=K1WPV5_MARBU|nr:uncharacterized protein MBM_07647 [Drepanopeziza brunnea f. sp. 'multigermtubi' MB_m1]EKD14417.1 hypothetical protein MBM_07647 [Drepanopeziza brunnea f. sp. 'multigermtubi' MB_m1]KAJ5034954.1 hypothetical protein L3040_008221 [Drepanopeziza brunnea f. sp. 'multigermtubi']